jgi:adenylate kinase family enzyme
MAHPESVSSADEPAPLSLPTPVLNSARAALGTRVVILGLSGSGKTTLAESLARALDVLHVELDALHWEPNWTMARPDILRERVETALAGDAWVVDGNYNAVRDLTWPRATAIIWLDYPFPLVMARLFRRTVWRGARGVTLWNGNRERLGPQFFSRDSLFLWIIQQRPKHKREYPLIPTLPEAANARFIRLRSPRETARWLAQLTATGAPS